MTTKLEVRFSELHGPKPTLQVLAMDRKGAILASSNNRQMFGSILNGAVTWNGLAIEFRADLCPADAHFFPVVIHAPIGRSIAEAVGLVEFSLTDPVYRGDPVDVSQGGELDWFVVAVAEQISNRRLRFKNVSSFPTARGDVVNQLRELILWMQRETSDDDWIQVPTLDSSPCKGCTARDEEIEILKDERNELLIIIEKQEILIENLRKERREGLVSGLVGPETLSVLPSVDDTGTSLESLLRTQEDLIGSIKQHLVKLSSQVKTGQRMRAMPRMGIHN